MSTYALLCLLLLAPGARAGWTPPDPLRVGASGDYAPFSLRTPGGTFEGLDADLANRLAADLGVAIEFVTFRWPQLSADARREAFDLAASGVTMRPERALVGRFSRPYARTEAVLLIRDADAAQFPVTRAVDAPETRLAVNAGGHLERLARRRFPQAQLTPVTDNRSLPRLLRTSQADAVLTDSAEVRGWLAEGLRTLGPIRTDYKALFLPGGRQELAIRIDAWLVARENDGWMNQRRRRWIGTAGVATPGAMSLQATVALIRLRLELMPAVAAAKRATGQPIEDVSQEHRVLDRVQAGTSEPGRSAAVYRSLIEMAKDVQRSSETTPFAATLDQLRQTIQSIDQQLLRELIHLPAESAATWLAELSSALAALPVQETNVEKLAAALASGSPEHDK